jgi:hypothetical protein
MAPRANRRRTSGGINRFSIDALARDVPLELLLTRIHVAFAASIDLTRSMASAKFVNAFSGPSW